MIKDKKRKEEKENSANKITFNEKFNRVSRRASANYEKINIQKVAMVKEVKNEMPMNPPIYVGISPPRKSS